MPSISRDIVLIISGLLPSFIWMLFYLKQDLHPEPRSLITKTFLMGIIVSPLAILFQEGFHQLSGTFPGLIAADSPTFFLWAAFVEEMVKLYAVRLIVLRNPEFDEPVDAMIYMIVAGLGFAAIENILVLFRTIPDGANAAFTVWILRFVGATLLHALSCALLGYFLALSWFFQEHRSKLLVLGIILATLFHFTFNMFLANSSNRISGLAYATGLLLVVSFLISVLFDKIKERRAMHRVQLMAQVQSA